MNKSFDEIGDSVGRLGGEIISLAGDITTSTLEMINGIGRACKLEYSVN